MSCVPPEILRGAYRELALKTREPDLSKFEKQQKVQSWLSRYRRQTVGDLLRSTLEFSLTQRPDLRLVEERVLSAVSGTPMDEVKSILEQAQQSPQVMDQLRRALPPGTLDTLIRIT